MPDYYISYCCCSRSSVFHFPEKFSSSLKITLFSVHPLLRQQSSFYCFIGVIPFRSHLSGSPRSRASACRSESCRRRGWNKRFSGSPQSAPAKLPPERKPSLQRPICLRRDLSSEVSPTSDFPRSPTSEFASKTTSGVLARKTQPRDLGVSPVCVLLGKYTTIN